MLDTDPNPAYFGQPARKWTYRNCGGVGIPGNQGISPGWADTYRFTLGGQYFILDGGNGHAPVPPGDYIFRITVNPPFVAGPMELCPHLDTDGNCRQLPESDYTNNVTQVPITLPPNPGKRGVGPLAGTPPLKEEPPDGC